MTSIQYGQNNIYEQLRPRSLITGSLLRSKMIAAKELFAGLLKDKKNFKRTRNQFIHKLQKSLLFNSTPRVKKKDWLHCIIQL